MNRRVSSALYFYAQQRERLVVTDDSAQFTGSGTLNRAVHPRWSQTSA